MVLPERRRSRTTAALLAGALLAWSSTARADPPTTVLLLRSRDGRDARRWRAAEERTRDELRMLKIRVEEVQVRDDVADIERALTEHGARAAVRVRRDGDQGRAEVWWIDPQQDEPRALELDALPVEGSEAASLAALQTAELVHARVSPPLPAAGHPDPPHVPSIIAPPPVATPVATPPFAPPPVAPIVTAPTRPSERRPPSIPLEALIEPPGDPQPAPAPASPPPPRRPRDAFGVVALVGGGPGGAGVLAGGAIALQRRLLQSSLWFRSELRGETAASWRVVDGDAIRTGRAGFHLLIVWIARDHARVSPRLGLGGGPGVAWALGRASDPRQNGNDLAVIGAVHGLAGAAIRVHPRVRVVVGLDVELLLPPVVVQIAGADVVHMGTPLVHGVFGIEFGWPRPARATSGP